MREKEGWKIIILLFLHLKGSDVSEFCLHDPALSDSTPNGYLIHAETSILCFYGYLISHHILSTQCISWSGTSCMGVAGVVTGVLYPSQ